MRLQPRPPPETWPLDVRPRAWRPGLRRWAPSGDAVRAGDGISGSSLPWIRI